MKPLPLFGTGIRSISPAITAQRRLNCFYDIRTDGDKSPIALRGTPGYFVWTRVPESPIRGWRAIGSLMYVVAGGGLYQLDAGGNTTFLGSVGNSGQLVEMYDDSISMNIVDGVTGYNVALPSGAPVKINDPNFPYGTQSITVLDSRFLAPQPNTRNFLVSNQLAGSNWSPNLFGAKENYSSFLLAIDVLNGALVFWGAADMEFWQDVGASPMPYQRINGATQTWGLAALRSRAHIDNTMFFLGLNPSGGVQVVRINGYTPTPISNSDIEDIIAGFRIYSDAVALTYTTDGHAMYQLTFPNAGRSLLYDVKTQMWSEVQTGVGLVGRHAGNLGIVFNSRNYICDNASGNIYQLDSNTFTDNGTSIKRQVASRHIRQNGNEFSISEITLEMETGIGLPTGQGSTPQIMMQVSKDGGRTFGAEQWKSMGQLGHYEKRVMWDTLGASRDFVFQWTMTDPVKFVITNGEAVLFAGVEAGQ